MNKVASLVLLCLLCKLADAQTAIAGQDQRNESVAGSRITICSCGRVTFDRSMERATTHLNGNQA